MPRKEDAASAARKKLERKRVAAQERKAAAPGRKVIPPAHSNPVDASPPSDFISVSPSTGGGFPGAPASTGGGFPGAGTPWSIGGGFPTAPTSTGGRFPAGRHQDSPPSSFAAAPTSTGGRFPAGRRQDLPPSSFAATPTMATEHQWMDYSDASNWNNDPVPPGGFMSFMKNQSHPLPENAHLVGGTCNQGLFNYSPSVQPTGPMSHPNANVNADNGEAARTDERIIWSVDEDSRLMSAWLKCSLDPVQGNDRRKEQYWNDVVDTYNLTTPSVRRRTLKQAKDRWHKINKLSDLFHSAYLKARRTYTSGFNEEKWIAEAQRFYEANNSELKLGRFTLMDVWYLIRNEPKWKTYNDGLKDARKRKTSHQAADEVSDEEEDMDRGDNPRPPGQKAAKKALYESKGKVAEANLADDEEIQFLKEAQANRMKVLEVQQKLSTERLESSRLSHLAAKEHKEAKNLDIKAKMMDTYNCLLAKDERLMTDEEKADHVSMLKH